MWLMDFITKNSIAPPNAVKGNVTSAEGSDITIVSSGEHKRLKTCMPYGIVSRPPVGERAVVLPLDDGEVSLGVVTSGYGLEEGEIKIFSKGGASIVLKNDGKVLINGKEFVG